MSFDRSVRILALTALMPLLVGAPTILRAADADPWPGLKAELFQNRALLEQDGVVALEAPVRAEDAAIVPMTLRFANPAGLKTATLVIDQNPMPMAAAFTLGPDAGVGFIATRRIGAFELAIFHLAEMGLRLVLILHRRRRTAARRLDEFDVGMEAAVTGFGHGVDIAVGIDPDAR